MGVTTTQTNKPFNPRGNDQSPKGYNRAALYSGKALDFDGVNDYVDCGSIEVQSFSLITNVYLDLLSNTDTLAGNWDSSNGFMLYKNASNNMFVYINSAKVQTDISQYVGNWTQFVATYDGTTAKLYANGVLINSEAYAATITYSSGSTFKVGAYGNTPGGLLNGDVAGTKLFNTALTAAQVADLYNNPEKVVPTGVDNTALKLWLPMMEGAGTTAYDGSGNGNHGTISGATYVNGIGAPVAQTAVMDWNKGANYLEHTESIATSGYWYESVTINGGQLDPIGGTNAVEWVSTNTTNHQLFNAQVIAGDCVLSCYVKSDEPCAYLGAHNNAFAVYFDLTTQTISTTNGSGVSGEIEAFGDWYRIIAYFPAVNNEIQIGFLDAVYTGTSGGPWSVPTAIGTSGFIAFPSLIASTTKGPYIPNLTGVSLTSPVLLPQGLTTGRDITGVNLFENVRKQGALNLDGNSWAEVHDNASLDITSAISVEAWVYADEFADMNGAGIIAKWDEFSEQSYLFYTLDYNTYYFFISSTGSNNDNVTFSLDSADENKYNHLVCVYDGSNITMYKNGNVAVTKATALSSLYVSDKVLEIGRYDLSTTRTIETKIAQPRIYNRALTAAEVLQNYNSGKNTYK